MFGFLIPGWLKAALIVVPILGFIGYDWWEDRSYRGQINDLQIHLAQEQLANKDLRQAIYESQSSLAELRLQADRQNQAIEALRADQERRTAEAMGRVLKVLLEGSRRLEEASQVSPGPVEMNIWINKRFEHVL